MSDNSTNQVDLYVMKSIYLGQYSMQVFKAFIATLILGQVLLSNDAFAKDIKIEAYDAKGRRDLERDLVVRDGRVYQQDRQGRILNEKGYINLKDGAELDSKGRKTGRRFKAKGSD